MKTEDILKQYQELHDSLKKKKSLLIEEIQKIDKALSTNGGQLGSEKCSLTLKEAITEITNKTPKTKKQILSELISLGYHFSTTTPINSINATLYLKDTFNNKNGYFSPLNNPNQNRELESTESDTQCFG
ncbi:hypothetical protein OAF81_00370 [bacterium]|jgi:hypothetical protein|nr:hypothetical protein [bacterium]MDB4642530.1 hypothetical protein [Verrucomicrobiota bacterium]MDB4705455.1 hypothetical protein [Verrucomicrobiota bacterium]MDB4717243.1 hypothetical protein [Verrucomicrobiota bacterium]MDB4777692.1 hypothetical protein [Verrucomicrobiota bacterium]